MKFSKLVTTGFIIGALGIVIAIPSEDRSIGFAVFIVGFLLATAGIIAHVFSIPAQDKTRPILPGLKTAAIGFGVAVVGGLTALVLKQENLSDLFFYIGFAVMVIGILFGIVGVTKSNGLD